MEEIMTFSWLTRLPLVCTFLGPKGGHLVAVCSEVGVDRVRMWGLVGRVPNTYMHMRLSAG